MQPDLVIRNGRVFDGGGAPGKLCDVAVSGDRIVECGTVDARGATEIDATGLYVAPGFIDIHSHSDFTLLVDPRAMSAVYQGVTCEVIGNCGFGCFPVRDPALAARSIYGFTDDIPLSWSSTAGYLERLESARPAVNVLTLAPNAQLRMSALGLAERPANPDELKAMRRMLEQSMEEGAWGYSTGLEYPAESGAPSEEIASLCQCVAHRGGFYATHTRHRDQGSVDAVREALRTGRDAGVRLQISHLLPRSGRDDGLRCMELVDEAVADGQDVAYDMHTRLHGLTYLATVLPAWAQAGTPQDIRDRLGDADVRARIRNTKSIVTAGGDWTRVTLLDNPAWPEYGRKSIAEIARSRGQDPFDTIFDLLSGIADRLSSVMVLIAAYGQEQQDEVFAHPLCMPASDATTLAPDGPLAGSAFHGAYTWAARFYSRMVRETGRLTPEAAIHKLTGQPAETVGLRGRGRIAPGAFADIAVFDPDEFADRGTLFEPSVLSAGMKHVMVNGVLTLRDGALTGDRSGSVLRFRQD